MYAKFQRELVSINIKYKKNMDFIQPMSPKY